MGETCRCFFVCCGFVCFFAVFFVLGEKMGLVFHSCLRFFSIAFGVGCWFFIGFFKIEKRSKK